MKLCATKLKSRPSIKFWLWFILASRQIKSMAFPLQQICSNLDDAKIWAKKRKVAKGMLQRCERLMTLNCHHLEFRWCQKMLAAILCKNLAFLHLQGKLSIIARDQFNRANVLSILTKQFLIQRQMSAQPSYASYVSLYVTNMFPDRSCPGLVLFLRGIHWAWLQMACTQ